MNPREIDIQVAEHIMGLDVTKDQHTKGIFANKHPDDPWDYYIGSSSDKVPAYSTDIAAAFDVVTAITKMRFPSDKLICQFVCCVDVRWRTYEGYEVAITREMDKHEKPWILVGGSGADLTAPMAICLAALATKGIKP